MSVCVVLAWCILPLAAMVGLRVAGPAQANISTAENISTASRTSISTSTSTPVILTSASVTAKTAGVTAHRAERAATWTVRPGDTLSAIAAALGISGGWQALYAANRSAVGPNPNAIRPGIILATPHQTAEGQAAQGQAAHAQAPRAPAQTPAQPRHQASPAPATPTQAPPVQARPSHPTAPVTRTAAGGMPRWLEDVLLAAGVLAATAFVAEPAAAIARRRKATGPAGSAGPAHPTGPLAAAQPARPARPARPAKLGRAAKSARPAKPVRHRASAGARNLARQAAEKAKIILADHERLIVTYSIRDHTVYVLTPPGEDPMVVLAAARLVLPEDTYMDLAGHLGVPSAWPPE